MWTAFRENWVLIMIMALYAIWRISGPSYRGYYGGFSLPHRSPPPLPLGKSDFPEPKRNEPKETGLPPMVPHKPMIMSPDWSEVEEIEKHEKENINKETKEEGAGKDTEHGDDIKMHFLED